MKGKVGQVKVSPLLPHFCPIALPCGKERLNFWEWKYETVAIIEDF